MDWQTREFWNVIFAVRFEKLQLNNIFERNDLKLNYILVTEA